MESINLIITNMKKVIIFLIVAAAIGCECISQVPKTQTIYANPTTCTAPLPNYTTIVTVSDNCSIKSYTQTPIAGTMLTVANPSVTVNLRAEDVQGNIRTKSFQVVLLDTIKPVFNFPASMLTYTPDQLKNMFFVIETALQEQIMDMMNTVPWEAEILGVPGDTVFSLNYNTIVSKEMFNIYRNR